MPHAMTEAFTLEEPTPAFAHEAAAPPRHPGVRPHGETPNERAMRTATAARTAAIGAGQAGQGRAGG